jgi:hypothetical protein
MPEKPAPRVVGFIYSNPVNPRLQGALAPEAAHVPEDFQKYFLNHIAGLALVVQETQCQRVNRLLEADQQFLVGPFRAFAQGFYKVEICRIHRFRRRTFGA